MKNNATAGFTLVEMLVSLAILGLIATMLVSGMHQSALQLSRSQVRLNAEDRVASTQQLLRERLEQLRPVQRLDSADPIIDAEGDRGTFTFLAPPLDRAEPDALWRYRITTTAAGDLALFWTNSLDHRFSRQLRETTGWSRMTLLEQVSTMRISYFATDPINGGRRWQTIWGRRPQPPDLVRIELGFRDPRHPPFVDLVVRPRATVNAACRIDALTGRCEPRT